MRFLLAIFLCSCSGLKLDSIKRPEKTLQAKWIKEFDPFYLSGNLPISTGSPLIVDDVLYLGTLQGDFHAIDAETGRQIWKVHEGHEISSGSLVVKDQVFYGGIQGRLFSRNRQSGELKYAIDLGAPIESPPVYDQGRLLVFLRGHQLVCLDAETGKILWNYRRAIAITVTLQKNSKPLIIRNKVIVGFADGFVVSLSLEEGSVLWEQKIVENQKFVDVDLDPFLFQDMVIAGSPSAQLRGLDYQSGKVKIQFSEISTSQPLIRGDYLVLGTPDGEVVFVNFSGEIIKKKQISKVPINQIAWWKEKLIAVSFKGEVMALDPISLDVVDNFLLGSDQSAVFGELTIGNSGMALFSSRNRLYYFQ